jgi:hypothetical protein
MRSRLGRLSALAAVCAGAAFAASAPAAYATAPCATIQGAGSSLQNIAQNNVWSLGFSLGGKGWEKGICFVAPKEEPMVTYNSTSSGKGLAQWGAGSGVLKPGETGETSFPAFIGSDVAPEGSATTGQISEMDKAGKEGTTNNEIIAVPVAQSAVAVIVSMPKTASCTATVGSTEPEIKSKTLEEEWFSDNVTFTTLIKNAGVSCADIPKLYGRFSPSGTTAGFKRYLASLNSSNKATWVTKTSTAVESESPSEWPMVPEETVAGEKLEKGSQLAKAVYEKPSSTGAIGYADLADAVAAGFSQEVKSPHKVGSEEFYSFYVVVQNNTISSTAAYASPNNSGASNCKEATYTEPTEVKLNEDWSGARQNNTEGGGSENYPICTLTFDVAWHRYKFPEWEAGKKYTEEQMNTVYAYLHYILTEGQGASLTEHQYGALAPTTKTKAEKGLEKKPTEAGANIVF